MFRFLKLPSNTLDDNVPSGFLRIGDHEETLAEFIFGNSTSVSGRKHCWIRVRATIDISLRTSGESHPSREPISTAINTMVSPDLFSCDNIGPIQLATEKMAAFLWLAAHPNSPTLSR